MPVTLPTPIEFRLPEGRRPARPDGTDTTHVAFAAVHPRPDAGFAADITIDGDAQPATVPLARPADESVERLREVAESVTVPDRREAGTAEAPALIQRLALSAAAEGVRRDLVQSQVYLSLPDVWDPARRAVIRLALTATATQHDAVLGDFQDFVRTVRADTGTAGER